MIFQGGGGVRTPCAPMWIRPCHGFRLYKTILHVNVVSYNYGLPGEKTCLRGVRSCRVNYPAQLHRLCSILKFCKRQLRYCALRITKVLAGWLDCADVQAGLRFCCSHATASDFLATGSILLNHCFAQVEY